MRVCRACLAQSRQPKRKREPCASVDTAEQSTTGLARSPVAAARLSGQQLQAFKLHQLTKVPCSWTTNHGARFLMRVLQLKASVTMPGFIIVRRQHIWHFCCVCRSIPSVCSVRQALPLFSFISYRFTARKCKK